MDRTDQGRPVDEKAERDAALDEALEETFPTSDAIQLSAHAEGGSGSPPPRLRKV